MGVNQDTFQSVMRAERARKKMSQTEVAEKIGVSKYSILRFENGDTLPTFDTACDLADLFGISLEELAGKEAKDQDVFGG